MGEEAIFDPELNFRFMPNFSSGFDVSETFVTVAVEGAAGLGVSTGLGAGFGSGFGASTGLETELGLGVSTGLEIVTGLATSTGLEEETDLGTSTGLETVSGFAVSVLSLPYFLNLSLQDDEEVSVVNSKDVVVEE